MEAQKTLRNLVGIVVGMFAFGWLLVPMYDVFCEITVLSERAEVLGSNASNKQIINEKINALNIKLKKPEFQEDEALKNEIDFLNFVLEKSN